MGSSEGSSSTPLNSSGMDFSNRTQALDFLGQILDDSVFQVTGNQYARYFWYGVVVVIGIAGIFNFVEMMTLKNRLVSLDQTRKALGMLTNNQDQISCSKQSSTYRANKHLLKNGGYNHSNFPRGILPAVQPI